MSTYHRSGYGESSSTFALVTVNGQDISKQHSISVKINQAMLEHSSFELICPSETFNDKNTYPLKNSLKLLGGDVTIQFRKQAENESLFTGQITYVDYKKNNKYPFIVLRGKSYSALLDSQKHCRTYHNKTLKEMVQSAFSEYNGNKIELICEPNHKSIIPYAVSYNETAYEFIQRLAVRYGEYMFWNGSQLIFGRGNQIRTELKEGRDYLDYRLSAGIAPQHLHYENYHPDSSEIQTAQSENAAGKTNPFQEKAVDSAHKVYIKLPDAVYFDSLSEEKNNVQKLKLEQHQKALENLVTIQAETTNAKLRLGDIAGMLACVAEFSGHKDSGTPIESYLITQIEHTYTAEGYSNQFTAIPREQEIAPYWNMEAYPKAENQMAEVTDNNDPLQLNRIKVQFPWQKKSGETTPWIRLIQAHGGADQGFHLVPEISHEVAISFRGNNAEMPVVTGSLYNGKQKSGFHTAKNNYKVLKTRSGHTIKLDDTEGKEKIQVFDKEKNIFEIDTEQNTITISANATINLNATDINMTATNMITMNAGTLIDGKAGVTTSFISGAKGIFSAGTNVSLAAGKTLSVSGGKNASFKSGNGSQMTLNSQGNASLKGKKQVHVASDEKIEVVSKKDSEFKSNKTKIQAKSKTEINSGKVHIS